MLIPCTTLHWIIQKFGHRYTLNLILRVFTWSLNHSWCFHYVSARSCVINSCQTAPLLLLINLTWKYPQKVYWLTFDPQMTWNSSLGYPFFLKSKNDHGQIFSLSDHPPCYMVPFNLMLELFSPGDFCHFLWPVYIGIKVYRSGKKSLWSQVAKNGWTNLSIWYGETVWPFSGWIFFKRL